jgi:hypothetical protein
MHYGQLALFACIKLVEKMGLPCWDLIKDDVQEACTDLTRRNGTMWHEALTKVACTAATHHTIDALLSLLLGN